MTEREILDILETICRYLTESNDLERGRLLALATLGELIGKLTVYVEAEEAFAEAEETEGAPV
jgi:hypothetical protein